MGDSYESKFSSVNPTSTSEGSEIKELKHLISKRQSNAQVLRLYRELKKLNIGTNDIEQIAANLVITRLNNEGVGVESVINNVESTTCWRDSIIVKKLINLKIKGIVKYGEKIEKKILILFRAEYDKERPSVFRKARNDIIRESNMLWREGLAEQDERIKHLSWI
jgi:hypothetical protein